MDTRPFSRVGRDLGTRLTDKTDCFTPCAARGVMIAQGLIQGRWNGWLATWKLWIEKNSRKFLLNHGLHVQVISGYLQQLWWWYDSFWICSFVTGFPQFWRELRNLSTLKFCAYNIYVKICWVAGYIYRYAEIDRINCKPFFTSDYIVLIIPIKNWHLSPYVGQSVDFGQRSLIAYSIDDASHINWAGMVSQGPHQCY